MSRLKKYILICVVIFTCIFSISFLTFDKYLNVKREEVEEANQETLAREKEKSLDNSIIITLYKDDTKEQETTLKELKKSLGVSDDINEKDLSKTLADKGYKLDGVYDKQIIYRRSIKDSIEPNMFYLGECDGCIAIYTSDAEANLTINDPQNDIIKEGKKFKDLTKNDQDMIKNRELKFVSKEEAEEKISELVS